jgi:hypothetical protein
MPLKAGSMGLLLKTAINFVVAKTSFFSLAAVLIDSQGYCAARS